MDSIKGFATLSITECCTCWTWIASTRPDYCERWVLTAFEAQVALERINEKDRERERERSRGTDSVCSQANASGMFVAPIRWLLLQDPRIRDQSIDQITETFQSMAVFPDSDVLLARRLRDDFMEIRSVYRPSRYRQVILEDRGNWTAGRGVQAKNLEPASRRRRNLQQTPLRSCLVVGTYVFTKYYRVTEF